MKTEGIGSSLSLCRKGNKPISDKSGCIQRFSEEKKEMQPVMSAPLHHLGQLHTKPPSRCPSPCGVAVERLVKVNVRKWTKTMDCRVRFDIRQKKDFNHPETHQNGCSMKNYTL